MAKREVLAGVGYGKQRSQLDIVRQELSLLIHRERNIEAEFEPGRHAIGELRSSIQRMVRDQRAGISRLGDATDSIVEVLLDGELTDLVDLGVVDLDLVHRMRDMRAQAAQCRSRRQKKRRAAKPCPQTHHVPPDPTPRWHVASHAGIPN
jgi:hypothetical protein